jgi:predicted ArsR family transcriptional regulator
MTVVDSTHRALAEPSRARLLELLADAPDGLDVATLAARVGLHANTVRWHLGVLAEAGLVESETNGRGARGRPRVVYRPRRGAAERPQENYRLLATILASSLDADDAGARRAAAAGREWGRFLVDRPAPFARPDVGAALDAVTRLLAANGFEPERDDERGALHMRRCPFRELAEQHGRTVCGLHLGMLRGALDELRAPVQVESLEPFAEHGRCTAHLRRA